MNRADYWQDEYDRAAATYREKQKAFEVADSARAVALAEMNRADRELNRLFDLRFDPPPTVTSRHCACDTDHPTFKERGHHPLCPQASRGQL